jgi:broad specificity phosphatase PhoE
VRRLVLVRQATTDAVRRAAFPDDEPLDAAGIAAARALAGRLGRSEALCSTSERSRATAVKAAVIRALGAPLDTVWQVDGAPLGATELHAHDGRWTVVRVNGAIA